MQTFFILITFTTIFGLARSIYLSPVDENENAKNNPDWNDLKVTWGINPFSSSHFVKMPRTEAEAIKEGWTREKNCSTVNGNRYMFKGDRAVLLSYNAAGVIAGLSTAIPKGLPFNFPSRNIVGLFMDEGDSYTINSYFVDPTSVCSKTLSERQSTGDRLVIKGNTMEINVPMVESNITSFWTLGECFWTMGVHYWADVSGPLGLDSKADNFVPMFLQYNKGKLNGFGWGFNADLKSVANRFEYPTPDVLGSFFKVVPKFMSDPTQAGVLTTLHIYLDSTPQLNFC